MSHDFPAPTPESQVRLSRAGLEFLAEFLEVARRRRPQDVEVMGELGNVYTRLGRYAEGLAVDRALVELAPDNPTAHYNFACSLALCGERTAALDALERAVELGYTDGRFLAEDQDLADLRGEERFQSLVARLGARRG